MKKNANKYTRVPALILALFTLITVSFFTSCEDDSDSTGGTPVVNYVRLTDPLKSDSLVAHAFMGNNIAIMGENLQDVKEVWFNDQEAKLNTSFITANTIIVTIPNKIPATVTNEMKLITKGGIEVKYPFSVDVPAPMLQSMVCEYVKDGDIAVIKGNFFINDPNIPLQVIFPGNMPGEITESNINEIKVKVPAGTGVGPIQVKSIYGSSRSVFYFRDDRNLLLDFDALTAAGGWRSGVLDNANPTGISGKYVRFKGEMPGAGTWNEDAFSFNFWPEKAGRPDVTYSGDIATSALKFECYVVEPWQSAALQMIFTPYGTKDTNGFIGDGNTPRGLWIPWKESGSYKTEGWTTVTIPLSEFKFKPDGGPSTVALTKEMMKGLTFFVWNGGIEGTDGNVHMCIDNIRVVPIQ